MIPNFSISNLSKHFSKFIKKNIVNHWEKKKTPYFYWIPLVELDDPKGTKL